MHIHGKKFGLIQNWFQEEAKKFCAENGFEPTAAAEGGGTQSEVNSTRKDA